MKYFALLLLALFAFSFSDCKEYKRHRKAVFTQDFPFDRENTGLSTFFEKHYESLSKYKTPNSWFTSLLEKIHAYIQPTATKEKVLSLDTKKRKADDDYVWWKFIPDFITKIYPEGPTKTWSAPCFASNSAKASWTQKGVDVTITLELTMSEPTSMFCNDYYLFATTSALSLQPFFFRGNHKVELTFKNLTDAQKHDLVLNGVRVFRFIVGEEEAIKSVYDTVMLFLPALLNQAVPEATAEANLKFLALYAGFVMEKRDITDIALNESEINPGDFFGVIRLDGLDPMLAWGMGATTGHTTIALRIDGVLYICESTTSSKYWPTNGIQKTPYQQWIKQAKAASYNVVHLPLSAEARSKFDEKKAVDWFVSTAQGLPYGFHNMLFTWLDTVSDNLPCLPPDYKLCLSPEFVEILAGLADKYDHTIGQLMYNQAFEKRLGLPPNLKTVDIMYEAAKKGLNWSQLVMIPEQDEWVYNDGASMVCDVFVCEIWKAGGIFGNLSSQIQCTEFTNWDAYALKVFDTTTPRRQECVTADPDLPYCQILGSHRVHLPGYNTKNPYPHMAEKCPSEAPKYERPADC